MHSNLQRSSLRRGIGLWIALATVITPGCMMATEDPGASAEPLTFEDGYLKYLRLDARPVGDTRPTTVTTTIGFGMRMLRVGNKGLRWYYWVDGDWEGADGTVSLRLEVKCDGSWESTYWTKTIDLSSVGDFGDHSLLRNDVCGGSNLQDARLRAQFGKDVEAGSGSLADFDLVGGAYDVHATRDLWEDSDDEYRDDRECATFGATGGLVSLCVRSGQSFVYYEHEGEDIEVHAELQTTCWDESRGEFEIIEEDDLSFEDGDRSIELARNCPNVRYQRLDWEEEL